VECPNCGAYNPEGRTLCWKCDEPLPSKPERPKRREQVGRMSPWTWAILIILGAIWIFGQCGAPRRLQPSPQEPPAVLVQPTR